MGGTIQEMMEAELDEHLGYDEYERSDNPDYRNGIKHKKLRSSYGEIPIDVPQDRDGDFEPQIVQKRKKDISAIEQKNHCNVGKRYDYKANIGYHRGYIRI